MSGREVRRGPSDLRVSRAYHAHVRPLRRHRCLSTNAPICPSIGLHQSVHLPGDVWPDDVRRPHFTTRQTARDHPWPAVITWYVPKCNFPYFQIQRTILGCSLPDSVKSTIDHSNSPPHRYVPAPTSWPQLKSMFLPGPRALHVAPLPPATSAHSLPVLGGLADL